MLIKITNYGGNIHCRSGRGRKDEIFFLSKLGFEKKHRLSIIDTSMISNSSLLIVKGIRLFLRSRIKEFNCSQSFVINLKRNVRRFSNHSHSSTSTNICNIMYFSNK